MYLKTLEDAHIDKLTKKIVVDHLIKTFSSSTLKIYSNQPASIIEDCELRREIICDILNMRSEEALKKINTKNIDIGPMLDHLIKQTFIEALINNDYNRAMDIAQEYLTEEKNDDDLFSLLGYRDEMNFLKEYGNLDKRMWLAQKINEEMCKNVYGRKKGGVWLLLNQHKSIMYYKEKYK